MCPADAIVALVREAGQVDALAAPDWKRDEPGLLEAARILGLPLWFVAAAELGVAVPVDPETLRLSHRKGLGMPGIAEACALSGGGVLVRARMANASATCVIAVHAGPSPRPLPIRERAQVCT